VFFAMEGVSRDIWIWGSEKHVIVGRMNGERGGQVVPRFGGENGGWEEVGFGYLWVSDILRDRRSRDVKDINWWNLLPCVTWM
jgi:hypothetical protein